MRRLIALLIAFFALTPTAEAGWTWPVSGEVITPYRNGSDPYANGQHRGVDIGAPVGTAVVAAAGGEVRFAGTAGSSGLTISIRTADGYDTSYLHLSSIATRAGSRVSAGDRIGAVGMTGTRSATPPHLHFGVRDAGTRHDYHDPLAFLPPPAPPAPAPEPPPPAPATAPQPAPPAAAPVGAPRVVPEPRGLPRVRPIARPPREPQGPPRPAPRGLPEPHDIPAARGAPAPMAASTARRSPHRAQSAGSRGSTAVLGPVSPAPHPSHNALPKLAGGGAEFVRPVSAPNTSSTRDSAGGADIGWLAACIGLLLAAGVLGLKGDRGAGTSRRLARLVRPLLARR